MAKMRMLKVIAAAAAVGLFLCGASFAEEGESKFMSMQKAEGKKTGDRGKGIGDRGRKKVDSSQLTVDREHGTPLDFARGGGDKGEKTVEVGKINVPAQYGKITETYDASSRSALRAPANLIIHIQDLHCNYEAQKALAKIVEHLYKNYGTTLILVEGGYGDVSLSYLRKEGTKARRLEVAEKYLKDGLIAGEEYLDIVSDYPIKLWGIEDEALYQENVDAFLAIDQVRDDLTKYLGAMNGAVNALKEKVYNKALFELDGKASLYKEEKLTLSEYIRYLGVTAEKLNLPLGGYPNFERIVKVQQLEKNTDFKKAEIERASLIEELSRRIAKNKLQELSSKSLAFKDGKITQGAFYGYLCKVSADGGVGLEEYPTLSKYMDYVRDSELVDAARLFSEISAVQGGLLEKLCRKDDERKLADISEIIGLISGIAELKLSPDDYDNFKKRKGSVDIKGWIEFLNELAGRHKIGHYVPAYSSIIDDNMAKLESFYVIAGKRDAVIVKNTKEALEREQGTVDRKRKTEKPVAAVLIAGGFHTERLSRLFKESDISYVVVAPKVASKTDEKLYRRVMKYKEEHKLKDANSTD